MGEARRRRLAGDYPAGPKSQLTFKSLPAEFTPKTATGGTTPTIPLKARVADFIRRIGEEPHLMPYVDVGSGYISGACHLNVAHRVKHYGGERVFGWMIWDSADFTEGEFHAVWRSPSDELVDITPRKDGEQFILFVPVRHIKAEPVGDGARIPANRTTMPGVPYTMFGQPSGKDAIIHPDMRTREHMAKLGMSHFIGGA